MMGLPSQVYEDIKGLIGWLILAIIIILIALGLFIEELTKNKELMNVGLVIFGFYGVLISLFAIWSFIFIIPLGILWLIFHWWWIPQLLSTLLIFITIVSKAPKITKIAGVFIFAIAALYPLFIPDYPKWQVVLVYLIASIIGGFMFGASADE